MGKITVKKKFIYIFTCITIGLISFVALAPPAAAVWVSHPADQTVSPGQSVTITWTMGGCYDGLEELPPIYGIEGPGVDIGPLLGYTASCQSSSSIQAGQTFTYTITVFCGITGPVIHDYVNIICPGTPGLAWYFIFGVIAVLGIIIIFKYHRKVRMIN